MLGKLKLELSATDAAEGLPENKLDYLRRAGRNLFDTEVGPVKVRVLAPKVTTFDASAGDVMAESVVVFEVEPLPSSLPLPEA